MDRRTTEDLIRLLERMPVTIRALLEDLPERLLHANEGPGTFSPFDVLGHLLQGEALDWVPRARRILEHGTDRPFEPFDRLGHEAELAGVGLAERLDRFDAARREGVAALREILERGSLDARGRHPDLGEVTLSELISTWVVHDLDHIAQIARVVARQYGDAVGPWEAYLPILRHREPDGSG